MTAYEMRISDWSSDVCSSDRRLVLQDVGDAGRAQLVLWRQPRHVLAADRDAPAVDVGEPEDRVQHRRLAGAVRADQAERLALADLQRELVQDLHLAVAGAQAGAPEEGSLSAPVRHPPLGNYSRGPRRRHQG